MERICFNKQVQKAFLEPQNSVLSLLSCKTNAFLESYISEQFVVKSILKDCLVTSYNWWVGCNNGKQYAIHIGNDIKPIDIAFSKELKRIGYEIIFVNINELEQTVSFIYNEEQYELEILVENLRLIPKEKERNFIVNTNINNIVFDWCCKNLDYKELIYNWTIEKFFLSKYFDFLTNLDVVWANKINGKNTFFIGEIKFKSKNKDNVFIMNLGEKKLYEKIVKNTDIQVVAIALVSNKEERQATIIELMNKKDFPMFYMLLKKEDFDNLTIKSNQLSDFSKQYGQALQNTVEFSFQKFKRVVDFREIGKENKTFLSVLNRKLTQYSYLLKGDKSCWQKHLAKFYALFDMQTNGFDVDYNNYLNQEDIGSNILNINGYKILFKFVESTRSWNVTLEEKEFHLAKKQGVDFILVYQNISNNIDTFFNLKEVSQNGQVFYLIDETTSSDAIKILGYLSFEIFDKYKHCLKAGIPKSQKNYYAAKKLNGYVTNMNDKNHKSNQDTYFLQLLGWQASGIDKEPKECQLQRYDKTKRLPFASSYIYY